MTAEIILGKKRITRDSMPYVIAEIGVNHEGKLSQALELIDLAKEGGADAAKFQTYKAEKLASKYSPAYWDTKKENSFPDDPHDINMDMIWLKKLYKKNKINILELDESNNTI